MHSSQQDYKTGFGGEFGVQTDRVDKNAVGWEHNEKLEQHESQSKKSDYQGGQLAQAGGHEQQQGAVGTNYVKARPDIPSRNTTNFKDRFEAMAKQSEEEARKKAAEEKKRREAKDMRDKEESSKVEEKRVKDIDAENQRREAQRKAEEEKLDRELEQKRMKEEAEYRKREEDDTRNANAERDRKEKMDAEMRLREEKRLEEERLRRQEREQSERRLKEEAEKLKAEKQKKEELERKKKEEEMNKKNAAQSSAHYDLPPEEDELYENEGGRASYQEDDLYENPEEKAHPGRGGYVEEDTYENPDEQPAARGGYVEDETYENPNEAASRGGGGITAIALYDYQAQADDEISFDPNDIISNIEMVDNDWWAVVLRGVRGMFPANFVQLCDSSVLPPKMDTETAIEDIYDTMEYEEEDTYDSMGD